MRGPYIVLLALFSGQCLSGSTAPASVEGLPQWTLVPASESDIDTVDPRVKWPWASSPVDVDNDGDLDFAFAGHHGGGAVWYLNDGKGKFTAVFKVVEKGRKEWPGGGYDPVWWDFNGDGLPDTLSRRSGCWINLGNTNFKRIGDIDGCFPLDINGDGVFEEVFRRAGTHRPIPRPMIIAPGVREIKGKTITELSFKRMAAPHTWTATSLGIDNTDQLPEEMKKKGSRHGKLSLKYCGDLNGDGIQDLMITRSIIGAVLWAHLKYQNDLCRDWVFLGQKDGTFRLGNKELGLPDEPKHNLFLMPDQNRDGRMDLLDAFAGAIYLSTAKGGFVKSDAKFSPAPELATDGFVWFMDPGNTGHTSFFISANHAYAKHLKNSGLYLNDGKGNFTRVQVGWGKLGSYSAWNLIPADFDGDGDLDVVVLQKQKDLTFYRNEGISGSHWLKVKPEQSVPSNSAMGCKLWVYQAGKLGQVDGLLHCSVAKMKTVSYYTAVATEFHVGLGKADKVDLRLRFPISGKVVEKEGVDANQLVAVKEE